MKKHTDINGHKFANAHLCGPLPADQTSGDGFVTDWQLQDADSPNGDQAPKRWGSPEYLRAIAEASHAVEASINRPAQSVRVASAANPRLTAIVLTTFISVGVLLWAGCKMASAVSVIAHQHTSQITQASSE